MTALGVQAPSPQNFEVMAIALKVNELLVAGL